MPQLLTADAYSRNIARRKAARVQTIPSTFRRWLLGRRNKARLGRSLRLLFICNYPQARYGIVEGLRQAGADVIALDTLVDGVAVRGLIEKACRDSRPDAVITRGWWKGLFEPEELADVLARTGLPLFYWATDDPTFYADVSLPLAQMSRFVFTPARECLSAYRRAGVRAQMLRFACNPEFHKPMPPDERFRHDIILVGSNFPSWSSFEHRSSGIERILIPLIEGDYDVRVWGRWWRPEGTIHDSEWKYRLPPANWGGWLPYEQIPAAYSSARIVLGLCTEGTSRSMVGIRPYEVLGCRAFHLTDYTPGIAGTFTDKRHLVWSKSARQTLSLVRHYLERPDERRRIALQGQQEVYRRHTYLQRARVMMARIWQYM